MANPIDLASLLVRSRDRPTPIINTSAIRVDDRCCIDSKPHSSVNERGRGRGKECESSLALPGVSKHAGGRLDYGKSSVDPTAGWRIPPLGERINRQSAERTMSSLRQESADRGRTRDRDQRTLQEQTSQS